MTTGRDRLNRIPEMSANVYTGLPSEIFLDMFQGNKSFEESMEDFNSMLLDQYGDTDMASAYEDDEFAVEKAAYQIEMAGSTDADALSSVLGLQTPWGPGLDIPGDLEAMMQEYPGITVGFNVNSDDDNPLDEADKISNHPAFYPLTERVEDEAENRGLLDRLGDFFSEMGEELGGVFEDYGSGAEIALSQFENYGEGLAARGEGMQAVGSSVLDMGAGILDMGERYLQTVGEHIEHNALVEQSGVEDQLFGGESPRTQERLDQIENRELKRADFRDWDRMLNDDLTGLMAFLGDDQNYANGTLDRATVMEWIEGLIASPQGSSQQEIGITMRDVVNQAQQTAIDKDRDDMVGQAFDRDDEYVDDDPGNNLGQPSYNQWQDQQTPTPPEFFDDEYFDPDPGNNLGEPSYDEWITEQDDPLAPPPNIQAGWSGDLGIEDIESGVLLEEDVLEEDVLEEDEDKGNGDGDEGASGSGYFDKDFLPYEKRFLREFNRRPGSGMHKYQSRINSLYNEADMLYWLHEPWSSRSWSEAMKIDQTARTGTPYSTGDRSPDKVMEGPVFPGSEAQLESDHYSKWVTGFLNSPDDLRGDNLYTAIEDLRDSMGQYENTVLSGDVLGTLKAGANADDGARWQMFMDPTNSESSKRLSLAVARYNAPPDADANFNNMQFRYYSDLLRNWEGSGKSRESFLNAFTSKRPGYSQA